MIIPIAAFLWPLPVFPACEELFKGSCIFDWHSNIGYSCCGLGRFCGDVPLTLLEITT